MPKKLVYDDVPEELNGIIIIDGNLVIEVGLNVVEKRLASKEDYFTLNQDTRHVRRLMNKYDGDL